MIPRNLERAVICWTSQENRLLLGVVSLAPRWDPPQTHRDQHANRQQAHHKNEHHPCHHQRYQERDGVLNALLDVIFVRTS